MNRKSEPNKPPFTVYYTETGLVIDALITTQEAAEPLIQVLQANSQLLQPRAAVSATGER